MVTVECRDRAWKAGIERAVMEPRGARAAMEILSTLLTVVVTSAKEYDQAPMSRWRSSIRGYRQCASAGRSRAQVVTWPKATSWYRADGSWNAVMPGRHVFAVWLVTMSAGLALLWLF